MNESEKPPQGWEKATFDDCFSVIGDGGRRMPKIGYTDEGQFPIIDQGEGDIAGWTDREDLLTHVVGPTFIFGDHTRRIKRIDTDFVVGAQGVKILIPSPAMIPEFAYYSLLNTQLVNRGYGRHFALLRNAMFVIPPLAEQRRIVEALEEHLSRLDAADSYTANARTSFDSLETSLLLETWKRAINNGSLTPVSEVADTTLGKMLDSRKNTGVPIPYLANINVRWGSFKLDNLRKVPLENREIDKFSIKAGDVLICEGGEPGRCAVWNDEPQTIAFQKAIHRARCGPSLRPAWLALCLKAAVVSGKTDHLLTGTTIKHLPQEKLRALRIPVPPLEVQDQLLSDFQEVFTSVQRQVEAIKIATARSEHVRALVMASAFAGTLVDQDPADEPASTLLERIAAERANEKPAVRRRASGKTEAKV